MYELFVYGIKIKKNISNINNKFLYLNSANIRKICTMEIVLPKREDEKESIVLESPKNIVVIGANGAGKSRFGQEIELLYPERSFRMSAESALNIKLNQPSLSGSISKLYLGRMADRQLVDSSIGVSPYITEFEQLLYLIQHEEFESLVELKNSLVDNKDAQSQKTKLDKTQALWEELFPHSKLKRVGEKIFVLSTDHPGSYNALEMSQGEKVAFYLIASALYAPEQAIILVEDPEIYLHRSIMNVIWNKIEQMRQDCVFVYMTHDIEFSSSRDESIRVWVKSFDIENRKFDYELIDDSDLLPEEIYLELLGSRKPVLFIEGTDYSSIDVKLYPYIFPDYTVKPLGGCTKVIETTKAFNEMKRFHHLDSKGIVDRDRRTQREIDYLRVRNVYVPDVAEVENLLMWEDVIKTVARRMLLDGNSVFDAVKKNVFQLFDKDVEAQALLHTRHRVRRDLEYMIDRRLSSIEELSEHIDTLTDNIDCRIVYETICLEFRQYIKDENYEAILRVYNQKGMLPQSRVTQLCGLVNKEKYLSFIISVLKENKEDACNIRNAIKRCFGLSS